MNMRLLVAAAAMTTLLSGAASAMPMAYVRAQDAGSVQTVRDQFDNGYGYGRGAYGYNQWDNRRNHSVSALEERRWQRRYKGWHRYNDRPRGWRDRGCVAAGPIWLCP